MGGWSANAKLPDQGAATQPVIHQDDIGVALPNLPDRRFTSACRHAHQFEVVASANDIGNGVRDCGGRVENEDAAASGISIHRCSISRAAGLQAEPDGI